MSLLAAAGYGLAGSTSEEAPSTKSGYVALQQVEAEGGIVLPKGTEVVFEANRLTGGGTVTLTLVVDAETLRAKFAPVDHKDFSALMYDVSK